MTEIKYRRVILGLVFSALILIYPYFVCPALSSTQVMTADEAGLTHLIASDRDEPEVYGYLNNSSSAVRLAAAQQLAKIGTNYSTSLLLSLATTDADGAVRQAASLSLWKIRYKVAPSTTYKQAVLLGILQRYIPGTPIDVTKTAEVKVWAIELLRDVAQDASVSAVSVVLKKVIDDPEVTQYSDYIKQKTQETLDILDYSGGKLQNPPTNLINSALTNTLAKPHIRQWAVRVLIRQNPEDLGTSLSLLLDTAVKQNDDAFASYLAGVIEERQNKSPVIEFISPQEGETVHQTPIQITGVSFGVPFVEHMNLNYGANTYTKSVVDDNGNTVTASITINLDNRPPVLAPIGNKSVIKGAFLQFKLIATDPEDQDIDLYYSADPLPNGATFDQATRTFSWTPQTAGNYALTFKVSDRYGMSTSEKINILVTTVSVPLPPTGLTASLVGNGVKLDWKDNSNNETNFRIERKLGTGGVWQQVRLVAQNITTCTDMGVSQHSTYYYRVCAVNAGGMSNYSNEVFVAIK